MKLLLEDMERAMADVMLSGYSAGAGIAPKFRELSADCARHGLHTGADLMMQIAQGLERRGHSMQKEDLDLTGRICRAVHYVSLCKEKLQETDITTRWDELTGGTP